MDQLSSALNMLGTRTARAFNDGVLGDGSGGGGYIPVQGVLIADNGDYLTDSAGNHLAYAQSQPLDVGYILTSDADTLVDSAGNKLLSFQLIP